MGRWLGGVFGNTKLATDPQASVTGRYTISDQYYMRQEGGWLAPAGTADRPAVSAAEVVTDHPGATSGVYHMQNSNARTGATGTYINYCLFGDSNKHFNIAWNLAMNIRFDQSNWKTYTGASKGNNTSAYHWNKWTVNAPENLSTNQVGGVDKFDYTQSCIGWGYFTPFTKIMIMTYSDHTTGFSDPGATAYYERASSSGNLRDLLSGSTDNVWSSGGRQGLYTDGNLTSATWNSARDQQQYTGNPWTQTQSTGNHNMSALTLSTYNLVFNTGVDSSSYKTTGTCDYNWTRITTTMCSNSQTGNGYPHVMQHGLGLLHQEAGYGGSKMYSLGQDSYCDNTNSHTATNDHRHNSGSNAFCNSGGWNATVNGFSIWVP